MLPELNVCDWQKAFEYAGEENGYWTDGSPNIRPAIPNSSISLDIFTREDVTVIYHIEEGENDGPNWICIGKLKDGRYFSLEAGCDYTGWDCQAGGNVAIGTTYDQIIRFGCSQDARQRFRIKLDT